MVNMNHVNKKSKERMIGYLIYLFNMVTHRYERKDRLYRMI